MILDRLPGRKESILNRIDEIKYEIIKLQHKANFDANDSAKYQLLLNELSALEKRSANLGK